MGGHLCKGRWAALELLNLEKTLIESFGCSCEWHTGEQQEQYHGTEGRVHPLSWESWNWLAKDALGAKTKMCSESN